MAQKKAHPMRCPECKCAVRFVETKAAGSDEVALLTHDGVKTLLKEIPEGEGAGEYDGPQSTDDESEDGEEYVYGHQECRMG